MLLDIKQTNLPGCLVIQPMVRGDERGRFVKTFQESEFKNLNLPTHFAEEYYSVSAKGVLRGLHFQIPPKEHEKIVYCLAGRVLDVLVDLRKYSSTYGQYKMIDLNSETGNMVFIPKGIAHGFCVLSEAAVLQYKVTSEYAPECDKGILWNSVGIPWPLDAPILSARDSQFPSLSNFVSPF